MLDWVSSLESCLLAEDFNFSEIEDFHGVEGGGTGSSQSEKLSAVSLRKSSPLFSLFLSLFTWPSRVRGFSNKLVGSSEK